LGPPPARLSRVLFLSAFLIATCGLVYELVAGALASYLLGDSVTWFSLIIGTYLSAMGLGSWLSRYVERNLVSRFVEVELVVALVGGFSAPVLFAAFAWTEFFQLALFSIVIATGTFVGLELPLLIRILERETSLKELVARVMALDYIGALAASVAFPLALVPHLGLMRTSLAFGLVNAGVALWTTFLFDAPSPILLRLRAMAIAVVTLLIVGTAMAGRAETAIEAQLYADPVAFAERTPYQRIVVTHGDGDTRLFLNGALQFSSRDEYRYHEALVHPAMASVAAPKRVLVLGGGDGLGVREVLKHDVESVTLVDLDPAMTTLFRDKDKLAALNDHALSDPRVTVVNADAFTWLREEAGDQRWDVVIADFPDPNDHGLGKLYTTYFYHLVDVHLAEGGALAVQSTSPLFSPNAYWCIVKTLEESGFSVRPYHAYVPAFGEWGFALAAKGQLGEFRELPAGMRFLDDATLPTLFVFPPDMQPREVPANRLDNQALVRLYDQDWRELLER
jgi:spermidine synthase